MNILILTITLYLQLLITRVSTLPLARSKRTKTVPSKEDNLNCTRTVLKRQKRASHPAFIYSYNTAKFVKVTSQIKALTNKENKSSAELILKTHGLKGELSIQGKHSKRFVCMNSKGQVVPKKSFNKCQCLFYMRIHTNGFYTFRLVSDEKKFLGFKRSGDARLGHETKYNHKAARMMMERKLS